MIKLKDLLLEFSGVAHSRKSLEWVGHDYIPLSPPVMKQIMGDTPITTFHNLNWFSIKKHLPNVVGKKKGIFVDVCVSKCNNDLSWLPVPIFDTVLSSSSPKVLSVLPVV